MNMTMIPVTPEKLFKKLENILVELEARGRVKIYPKDITVEIG